MNFYKNLSNKEKRTIRTAALVLSLLLFLFLIILPLKERRDFYRSRMERSGKTLEKVAAMSARYRELRSHMAGLQRSTKTEIGDFTLFSFLDKAASDSDIKDNIKSMKPSVQSRESYTESTVLVELEDVGLKPLVNYLHRIESSGHNLRIGKVDIQPRYSNPDQIKVTLVISSIEMTQQ